MESSKFVSKSTADEDYQEGPSGRPNQLFVGGLPLKTTKLSLETYFESFGKLAECRIVLDKVTQKSRGFAFVSFVDEESMNKALHVQKHRFLKTDINVKQAKSKQETKSTNEEEKERKLFLVGLPFKTRVEDLSAHFSKYGKIESYELFSHRGFGFIMFKERISVINILNSEDSHVILEKEIECRPVLLRSELNPMKVPVRKEVRNDLPNLTDLVPKSNLSDIEGKSVTSQSSLLDELGFGFKLVSNIDIDKQETRPRNRKNLKLSSNQFHYKFDSAAPLNQPSYQLHTTSDILKSSQEKNLSGFLTSKSELSKSQVKSEGGSSSKATSNIQQEVEKMMSYIMEDDDDEPEGQYQMKNNSQQHTKDTLSELTNSHLEHPETTAKSSERKTFVSEWLSTTNEKEIDHPGASKNHLYKTVLQ